MKDFSSPSLEQEGEVKALSTGIVFRKDEIDRHHYPAFHQIDGLYICKRSKKIKVNILIKDGVKNIKKHLTLHHYILFPFQWFLMNLSTFLDYIV
jgi:phenylalanyl-tRNA synthetase alpha subunit